MPIELLRSLALYMLCNFPKWVILKIRERFSHFLVSKNESCNNDGRRSHFLYLLQLLVSGFLIA